MNGIPVGTWENIRGQESFQYFADWLDDPQGRPLSLSLPFRPGNLPYTGHVVTDFFDNLLPDSVAIRRRLAARYQLRDTTPFRLLSVLGRDCVGALQLLPEDEEPSGLFQIAGMPLTDAAIALILRNTTATTSLVRDDYDVDLRLSIAGAQEKTALLHHEGRWLLPTASTPTSHILKLPLGKVGNMQADMRTSVENEWLCAQIVAGYGLPVANTTIESFDGVKVLCVERFDRRLANDGSWIVRLPQEDFCQATGTPPALKYQMDGGPGIGTIMDFLLGSVEPERDREHFFKTQIVFWLLAATDGHAKNFSLALLPRGDYRSTPLYDVLSAHPILGSGANKLAAQKAKLAMAVRGSSNHYSIMQIQRRHWISQGRQTGLSQASVEQMIGQLIDTTDANLDHVAARLPKDFPADVADAIFNGVRKQCRKLAAMPADMPAA
jgi:serine/threonine-protein kinase HipA